MWGLATIYLTSFLKEQNNFSNTKEPNYYTCNPHILSHPINTIVLNLCGLPRNIDENILCRALAKFFSAKEILHAAALLEENDLISRDEKGFLKRNKMVTLSTTPGIKAEYSKNYFQQSLVLAETQFDLDLNEREYVIFSTHIRKEDMPKLKDLIREFRSSVYGLSKENSDTIIHVNLNAFTVATLSQSDDIDTMAAQNM